MGVFIIAEVGINHNGDIDIAKQLIEVASVAGCDAVKFQKRTIDKVYTQEFLLSARQSPWGTTQREQKQGLEFGEKEFQQLAAWCKSYGIEWFASAWDIDSQLFLRSHKLKYNKIASAMLVNIPLLRLVAEERNHTYISTGMSSLEEIDRAVEVFNIEGCSFELMHCNSTYPMDEADANLRVMDLLRERYGCPVGYSGHESNNLVTVCAVARGAKSIERHITLDRNMYGSDQKASIEPQELAELVKLIRRIEKILGSGEKILSPAELSTKKKLRG
jgi:N-acetylneuraminate synthase